MSVERLEGRLLFAAGDVDLTFGGGDGAASAPVEGSVRLAAFGADGSILAAGRILPSGATYGQLGLARYRPDGTLDPTFGPGGDDGDGVVTSPTGDASPVALAIAPDGKIVVAGFESLVRFNPDGSLDTSFGPGGVPVRVPVGHGSVIAIQFQEDGKILVGTEEVPFGGFEGPTEGFIHRYNDDGSLDNSFPSGSEFGYLPGTGPDDRDDQGLGDIDPFSVWVPDEFAPTAAKVSHAKDSAFTAARQGDGKIVALAWAHTLNSVRTDHTAVMRFNADGSLDPTFAHAVHSDNITGDRWVGIQPGTGRILAASGNGFRITALQSGPPLEAPRPLPDVPPEATLTTQFPRLPEQPITDVTEVTFTIRYEDDHAIDASTIDGGDVRVRLASYNFQEPVTAPAEFVSVDAGPDPRVRTATYRFVNPQDRTQPVPYGSYDIVVEPDQVFDDAGNAVAAGVLYAGSGFEVRSSVPQPVAIPTATVVSTTNVTTAGTAAVNIVVRYEDDLGVLGSTLGDGDVRVTAPDGTSSPATLVGGPLDGARLVWEVTYAYAPPAGGFTAAMNGTYVVSFESGQVGNLSAEPVPANPSAGTFTVAIPTDGPNLVATSLTARVGRTGAGGRVRGRAVVTVTNDGNQPAAGAGLVNVVVVASADPEFDAGDAEVAARPLRLSLRPGRRATVAMRLGRNRVALPPGDYFLLARVDAAGKVDETNEADNDAASTDPILHVLPAGSAQPARGRRREGLFATAAVLSD